MTTQLFIASVKATGGFHEGDLIFSKPQTSEFEAYMSLIEQAHPMGITADWTKISMEVFELARSTVFDPAVAFAEELKTYHG